MRIANSLSRGGQHALEAEVVAHRARAVHHLGAAEKRHERPADARVARGAEFLDRLLLRLGHLLGGNRRHAILRIEAHG